MRQCDLKLVELSSGWLGLLLIVVVISRDFPHDDISWWWSWRVRSLFPRTHTHHMSWGAHSRLKFGKKCNFCKLPYCLHWRLKSMKYSARHVCSNIFLNKWIMSLSHKQSHDNPIYCTIFSFLAPCGAPFCLLLY